MEIDPEIFKVFLSWEEASMYGRQVLIYLTLRSQLAPWQSDKYFPFGDFVSSKNFSCYNVVRVTW